LVRHGAGYTVLTQQPGLRQRLRLFVRLMHPLGLALAGWKNPMQRLAASCTFYAEWGCVTRDVTDDDGLHEPVRRCCATPAT